MAQRAIAGLRRRRDSGVIHPMDSTASPYRCPCLAGRERGRMFGYPVSEMENIRAAYDEVYVYTMGRPGFILQHVVDAFVVQTATAATKPIAIVFGLVGLYLHVE